LNAAPHRIDKLVVIGVGLIGGSYALALKAAGCTGTVIGIGRARLNLEEAVNLGIINRFVLHHDDWTAELATADVVLLATPVAQYPALFRAMAPRLGPHTIVTDAGSTKGDVIAAAREALGSALPRFVPGHPIAGTEQSGAAAAISTLFADRNVVLTPLPETDPLAIATVATSWQACGGRVRTLEPEMHDRIFAAVSHLPHLLAFALVDEFAARPNAEDLFRFAASGFRDFTRIAASSPEVWRDIALANRHALRSEVAAFRVQLERLAAMMDAGDGAGLEAMFARARVARREWDSRRVAGAGQPLPDDGPREP
jgi:prephenate dehydrogenase